jgi:hypothetical protein
VSARLRVIDPVALPADWEIKPGVPRTVGDCRDRDRSQPCAYLSCRHHLWLRLREEQPGNPAKGAQGDTTFRPSTNQTCALEVAERGGTSFSEIGELLGMHHTRVRQIAERALAKLKDAGANVDEMLEAL